MPKKDATLYISGKGLRVATSLAREKGIDVDSILASYGVTETDVIDPNTRISRQLVIDNFYEHIDVFDDPEIGLRGAELVKLEDLDIVGYIMQNCPHLLAAIEEFIRYSPLLQDSVKHHLEFYNGTVKLCYWEVGGRDVPPQLVDYGAGRRSRVIRLLTQGVVNPIEVHIARPRPPYPEHYRDFFRAPVIFEADRVAFYYTEANLRTPIEGSDERLRQILKDRADSILDALPKLDTFFEQGRYHITRQIQLGKKFTAATIARRLKMSERTFQRRLREYGSNYRELVDEVKREQALVLARDTEYNVTEIAHRVGFTDTTTFARAFLRWTGISPRAYLKKQRVNGLNTKDRVTCSDTWFAKTPSIAKSLGFMEYASITKW